MKDFEKVVKLRKTNRIKKPILCKELGLDIQEYEAFEKGEKKFEEYQLQKIANFFNVPLNYILDDKSYLNKIYSRHYKKHLIGSTLLFIFVLIFASLNLAYSIYKNISLMDIILIHGIIILLTISLYAVLIYSIKNDDFTLLGKMKKVTDYDANIGKNALFSILNTMLLDSLFSSSLFIINYTSLLKEKYLNYYNLGIIFIYIILIITSHSHINRKYLKKYKHGELI